MDLPPSLCGGVIQRKLILRTVVVFLLLLRRQGRRFEWIESDINASNSFFIRVVGSLLSPGNSEATRGYGILQGE